MDIKPIKTQADHKAALKTVESLMGAATNTPDGDRLDVLVTLIEAYESRHYAMDPPDPIEAIKFRMEQLQLSPKDLTPIFGRLNRVYEVLNRKRSLTLAMIRRLNAELRIPPESLITSAFSKPISKRRAARRRGGVR